MNHAFVVKWVEAAVYVADSILGIRSPYDTKYVFNKYIQCDFYTKVYKNGMAEIVINEALIKPWNVENLLGLSSFDASENKQKDEEAKKYFDDINFGSVLSICYGVFHEMRHIYQKDTVYANKNNRFAPRIHESPETCALWAKDIETHTANIEDIEKDNALNKDARLFAGYLVSRFLLEDQVFDGEEYKPYRDKYDAVCMPSDEDILKVVNYMTAKKNTAPVDVISSETPVRRETKIGRNDPCPCGSGRKYKNCCGKNVD